MRWIRGAAVAAATVAAAAVGTETPRAGAGTVPPPTGTIYFQDLSTLDPDTNTVVLYAMDGDGGGVTPVLRTDRHVRPSAILRGSVAPARWFLTMRTVPGEEIAGHPRRDVYAVRADGAEVRVTSAPTTEYWMPDWAPGESAGFAVVSVLARRWTGTDAPSSVVPWTAGMYLFFLSFDTGGDVTGVTGDVFPSLLFFDASVADRDSSAYYDTLGGPTPDVASYAWHRHGSLAVQDLSVDRPRIRLVNGGDLDFVPHLRFDGEDPAFGRDTDRLAYGRFVPRTGNNGVDRWEIETSVWGQERTTVASVPHPAGAGATRALSNPKVSPDGNHVVHQVTDEEGTSHIARETGVRLTSKSSNTVLVTWR
jgi:hypothetical protein